MVFVNGEKIGYAVENDSKIKRGQFYASIRARNRAKSNFKMVTDHFWNQKDEEVRLAQNEIDQEKKVAKQ